MGRCHHVVDSGLDPVAVFWEAMETLYNISFCKHKVFCIDGTEKTFRHKMYDQYKAQRPEKTDEFLAFKDYIERQIKKNHLYELNPEYESDDLLGSLSYQYKGDVRIGSADLDLSQLVDDRVIMLKPSKNKYDPAKYRSTVYEVVDKYYTVTRFGIRPDQIADWKVLAGDASDNIKLSLKGLGKVGAAKLLLFYNNLDGVYNNLESEDFILPKFKQPLLDCKDQAYLFKDLTTIRRDVQCSSLSKI